MVQDQVHLFRVSFTKKAITTNVLNLPLFLFLLFLFIIITNRIKRSVAASYNASLNVTAALGAAGVAPADSMAALEQNVRRRGRKERQTRDHG